MKKNNSGGPAQHFTQGLQYGLKLWSTNQELFPDAAAAHADGTFDFIELFSDSKEVPDYNALQKLKGIPVAIHAAHVGRFHDFLIGDHELDVWKQVLALTDFFASSVIVVHPGRNHTIESFKENLMKIDDPRIYIENMAGLDIDSNPMFGQNIDDLARICELKPICFDFEKAVKAACYQKLDYKEYIEEALQKLAPTYFHISGGNKESSIDEHLDLASSNFDLPWIKQVLESREGEKMLVFETPKRGGIANDIANMDYFRAL